MLKTTKEILPKSRIKLTISLPPEIMGRYFSTVYNKLAPQVEVKGFRPGKAPKHLTIMAIGENRLSSDIIDAALAETYGQALKQEKIIPVAPPQVSIKKMVDLTTDKAELEYEALIDILPEIKLGKYENIKIKKSKDEAVKKEEVDQVLSHLQRQHADFKDVQLPSKDGDRIEMDFTGTERGVVLENLTSKNYPVILGSKVLIPEFEKKIIGMKAGEEKEFDVTLGKDKLKKDVHFKVKIHLVQEVILPELNDALAAKFGQKKIEDLKKVVEADILSQKKLNQKQAAENELVEELLKITKVDVPESLVSQEVHRMIDQLKNQTESAGIPFEKYLEGLPGANPGMQKTEEDLHKDFAEQAEKTVKIGLILGEIGKAEKVDLSKEDAGHQVMDKLLEMAQK